METCDLCDSGLRQRYGSSSSKDDDNHQMCLFLLDKERIEQEIDQENHQEQHSKSDDQPISLKELSDNNHNSSLQGIDNEQSDQTDLLEALHLIPHKFFKQGTH